MSATVGSSELADLGLPRVDVDSHPHDRLGFRARLWSAIGVFLAAGAISACTADAPKAAPTSSSATARETPTNADWSAQADVMSPLLIDAVAPAPIPVRGSDENFHVAYELTVLNFSPRPAVLTSVETLAPDGSRVASLSQDDIAARMMVVADYGSAASAADGASAALWIPPGKTALLVLDDVYETREAIPASVTHQISASFGSAESGVGGIAVLWPDEVSQSGGTMTISNEEPVVVGAPLRGQGWLISNACCTLNGHRNVLLPVGGRINGAERFAIDASRIDVASTRARGYEALVEVDGDPDDNESYRAYGAPVLAVADATVVAVHSTDPDTAPGTLPLGPGFTLANLGGNLIALELVPDLFAVYYHLVPGSPTVRVGDTVTKGQEIARLGNSGNSSAAHLHFQLSRTPLIFSSESVPYVFEEFTVVGSIDADSGELIDEPPPGPRENALPLALTILDFP
ncbi:M23 family metallopeptidase [Microbacterium atlanticum]|uniref:M23 family metallopeptidase n=1 Tax=Microbacterium atlanticum TaxID=2782168 RepID=UPI0018890357|nr:M23 family metallopeptidase [Microbacterium atlanticum]